MLVKFLAHGTGSAQAAADYLTRDLDSQGAVRDDVTVLRGDPDQVAAVADALEFEHKYTSGVIAWAPEDQPSDQAINRVLDEFEQTAWAGLAPDRYAWRRCGTARRTAACTCMCSPRGATWRRARASTSRRRAGSRPMARSSRPATSTTAGAARTTRRGRGCSSRGTAPTSRRRRYERGSRMRPIPGTRSRTTCCSASRPGRCRTGPASSPPCRRRALRCRARARTT